MPALFSPVEGIRTKLPTLFTFMPKWNYESLGFLLASAMLGRFLVGLMRCVADWPTLNSKKETQEDKVKTEYERVFMEALGVPAGFVAIALGQDVGFHLANKLHPTLHPKHLFEGFKNSALLSPEKLATLERALTKTFTSPTKPLSEAHNILYQNLYTGAKIDAFVGHLPQKNMGIFPKQVQQQLEAYFYKNNLLTNAYALTGGMVASTLFSGVLWQWLNDNVIRHRIVPPLARASTPFVFHSPMPHKQHPVLLKRTAGPVPHTTMGVF